MKKVVVRLAVDDDADVQKLLGSVVRHVSALHGAMIVSGEGGTMIVDARDVEEGTKIAEFLAIDILETHGLVVEGDEDGPFGPFGAGGR